MVDSKGIKKLLKAKARALEDKARLIRRRVDNGSFVKETDDNRFRLYLNNSRAGIEGFNATVLALEDRLPTQDKELILYQLALRGDPLCVKFQEYLDTQPTNYLQILSHSTIIEDLVTRKMTESTYLGYLSGSLPLVPRSQLYLPKSKVGLEPTRTA